MAYTKIAPMGNVTGHGTFDTFWNTDNYKTLEEATEKKDYVVVDFVEDDKKIIYFEMYHIKNPETKLYHRLMIQHFVPGLGVDAWDDYEMAKLAQKLIERD